MNTTKNTYAVLAIILLFVITWIVMLQLTQQRIQLEGQKKLYNYKTNESPFLWSFNSFTTDIVTPYQKYWKAHNNDSYISADINTQPLLSLNLSGERINTKLFSSLQLKSPGKLNGMLVIQIKRKFDDHVFYYSEPISLLSNAQIIDLEIKWKGISNNNNDVKDFIWGEDAISSLVLMFKNPDNSIKLTSVSLLFNALNRSTINNIEAKLTNVNISCKGQLESGLNSESSRVNVFMLEENCWLPSNYMWLKKYVDTLFPGSILLIKNKPLLDDVSVHRVNKNYSHITSINGVFYLLVVVFLICIFLILKNIKKDIQVMSVNSSWKHAYTSIFAVSLIFVIILSFYNVPNYETFKVWPMYFLWALVQQFILGFILAEKIFYKNNHNVGLSSFFAAAIFSIFHLPSVTLSLVTFLAGLFWSYAWLKYKRIVPLAISHSVLALMFYVSMPDQYLYSARVFHWFWQ